MKGFVDGFTKAVTKAEQTFEKAARKTAEQLADPRSVPQSDVDDAWREFADACKDTESTVSDAAREEFKEHILKNMQAAGMSKEEAEKWFEQKWTDVKDLADKGIQYAPKAGLAIKMAGLAVAAAVVGGIGLIFAPTASNQGQKFAENMGRDNVMLAQVEANVQLSVSAERFAEMGSLLNIPEVPPSAFQVPEAAAAQPAMPVAAAAVPAPIALPAPVEAIANVPVAVEVNNGSNTYRGRTNVGDVYRTVPEAREQIEHYTSTIQHDYIDKSLLNPNRVPDEPREPERSWQHHVNIDVDAGFASAHFHM